MSDDSGVSTRDGALSTTPQGEHRPLWKKLTRGLAALLLLAAACGLLIIPLNQQAADHNGTLDFANFYTAGRIVVTGQASHLYDIHLQERVERQASPGGPFQPYYHPPFEALLFAPFAWFSYPHAFLLWAALNLVVFGVLIFLINRAGMQLRAARYMIWLGICFFFVLGCLALGQDSLLLAPIFLLTFLAMKQRRDFFAGLALGLGLFRFEIALPFAFVFLLRGRWRLLSGFLIAALAGSAASISLVGWSGVLAYAGALLKVVSSSGQWATMVGPATMPSLRGALATLLGRAVSPSVLLAFVLAGSLALLGWAAWQFKSIANPEVPSFDLEFSLATLAALLASYHLFVHELTPLIVIGYLMLGYEGRRLREGILRNRRGAALLVIFALVYGVGGALFHFRDFSVLFIVLLGMMIWLSQEISALPVNAQSGEA